MGFVQVMALEMMNNIFRTYGAINDINLKENSVHMMGTYHPVEPLTGITGQTKKGI